MKDGYHVNCTVSSNFLLDKGRVAENLQKECLCYFIISSTSLWRNQFNHIRKILNLKDFVVHKKDVFAESSLAHAASWGLPLPFRFQCALLWLQEQVTPVYYDFCSVSVETIGLRSFTETADCLDDFETIEYFMKHFTFIFQMTFRHHPPPHPLRLSNYQKYSHLTWPNLT